MKLFKVEAVFEEFDNLKGLPLDIQNLFKQADLVRKNAYAPYSKFLVGCSLLLDNGEVVSGSNQENASYPSGLCAERTAIYFAGATYPKANIVKMAIIAGSTKQITDTPIPPCGACRQTISEYEFKQEKPIEIYFKGEKGSVIYSKSLANLLPLSFNKNAL
ncbi:cytidine deaminase [Aurantibacter sp.]|uniref:cytidine deaminase n=1 Tax=Aurantibacter sp. TaxID=2807103 RepID=UPI0035C813D3